MNFNKIIKLLTLLIIISIFSGIKPANAEVITLPSQKNIIASSDLNKDSKNKIGWLQEINDFGTPVWRYYDNNGNKHIGMLVENNNIYYFNSNGDLIQ